jgi:hypothetical protein
MKCSSEPIANQMNKGDGCTGHFWERQHRSPNRTGCLTEEALLSGMAYVDLNPIRANICNTLGEPGHTNNGTMK